MIGTLRAVGWIKHVPELLREHPPSARSFWRTVRQRVGTFGGAVEPRTLDQDAFTAPTQAASGEQEEASVPELAAEVPDDVAAPPAFDPIEHARTIDWFDPDVDPIDILNEPTGRD